MITAIVKADLCPGDVVAKLGGVTNETGLHSNSNSN